MRGRGSRLLCLVLLLGACAGRSHRDTVPSHDGDPSHDAAREWQTEKPQSPPVRVIGPAPALPPPAPPPELRELTPQELDRYRRVQRFVHAAARENDLPP